MAYNKVTLDLTGDPKELNDVLKNSESLITRYGKKIQNILTSVGNAIKYSLSTTAKSVSTAISGFKNLFFTLVDVSKSVGLLNTQVSSFNSLIDNGILAIREYVLNLQTTWQIQSDLTLAIKLTGKAAGYTSEQMQEYSEYLEKTTKYSKEATLGAEQIIAHFRDIRGDNFKEATKAAQDMATELHISLAQAASEVGNALQNPIEAFAQLEQRNIFFTKAEQNTILKLLEANKVIEAQSIVLKKLNSSFGGAAQNEVNDFFIKIEQIRNRLYRVAQVIAEHVIGAFNKLFKATDDGKSSLEAYIAYVESLVPKIKNLIDVGIQKMQEWAVIIKDKLVVAFNYLTEISIAGISLIQTAFQNLSKIVRIVTANFELQLEKLKQNWLIVWTRVIPASIRWVERIFKEVTEVKIPNFFTRMLQKVLTIMTKGLIHGIIKLIDVASGRWGIMLAIKGTGMGQRMMLKFLKSVIETPLKMGGIYAKVFKGMFGIAGFSIEKIGASIGRKLAESEAAERQAKDKAFVNNYGEDAIENFFKTLLPERAQRTSLESPDFFGMFEREETEKEKALKEEIESLKEEISQDFADNKETNSKKVDELKKKMSEYLVEQQKASKEFRDEFGGKNAFNPLLLSDEKKKYERKEAEEARLRRLKEMEERNKHQETKEIKKIPDAVRGLEEFWYKHSSPIEQNTKAIKENTSAIKNEEKKEEILPEFRDALEGNKKRAATGFSAVMALLPNRRTAERVKREQEKRNRLASIKGKNLKRLAGRTSKRTPEQEQKLAARREQNLQRSIEIQRKRAEQHFEGMEKSKKMHEDIQARREARHKEFNEMRKNLRGKREQNTENVNMKLAFKEANKDVVSHLKGIQKNTKDIIKVSGV